MKYLILILGLSLIAGCSGSGKKEGTQLPKLTVPSTAANPALFDVWTLNANMTDYDCPGGIQESATTSEIRLVQDGAGCLIKGSLADGTLLTNSNKLMTPEQTRCVVGSNIVTLEWVPTIKGEGCEGQISVAMRLELTGGKLVGTYGGRLDTTEACKEQVHCNGTATVVGLKGRYAQ
ncbi:MAG: hypothetical protein Q7S00_04610 [bacterium]|nr:hypothetical protein [bacterium]